MLRAKKLRPWRAHRSFFSRVIVITRSFDVALNGRRAQLPRRGTHYSFAKNEWKMLFGFEKMETQHMKMCCAITPNALHKNDSELTCQYRQNLWLGLATAVQRSASAVCALKAPNVVNIWIVEQLKPQCWLWSHWTLLQTYTCVFPFLDFPSSIIRRKIWSTLPSLHTKSEQKIDRKITPMILE